MPRPGHRPDAHLVNRRDQTIRLSAADSRPALDPLTGRGRRTSRTKARQIEGSEDAAKLPRPRAAACAHFAALPLVRSPATRSARLPSLRSAHFAPRGAALSTGWQTRPNPHALSRGQITIHLIELYKSLGGGLAYEQE